MKIFNIFNDLFSENGSSELSGIEINPASGLFMIEDSGIDVGGNPYGTDDSDSSRCIDIDVCNFDC